MFYESILLLLCFLHLCFSYLKQTATWLEQEAACCFSKCIYDAYKDAFVCEIYRSVFCFVVTASSNATLRLIAMNLMTRIW